jgi:hypothetical protein
MNAIPVTACNAFREPGESVRSENDSSRQDHRPCAGDVRGLPPRVAADQPHQLVDRRGIAVTASSPEAMEARLKPMEVLYITGHSLGAAMAAIEAVLARTGPNYQAAFDETLKATYTFGQPMIGSPELAAACNADQFLGTNVVR